MYFIQSTSETEEYTRKLWPSPPLALILAEPPKTNPNIASTRCGQKDSLM